MNTPVVILYKNANHPADATARVVRELAHGLEAAGYATTVHGMDPGAQIQRTRPEGGLLPLAGYVLGKIKDKFAETGFLLQAARTLRQQPDAPQVVISVDYPTGIGLAPQIARLLGRRRLHAISWVMDDYQSQKLTRSPLAVVAFLRRSVDLLGIRLADTVVTIGSCMADQIRRRTGRQSRVIRVWAHMPAGRPDPGAVERVREDWGVAQRTAVLYSGHAALHHPLQALADAAESLAGQSEIEFVVSGVGLELERLRKASDAAALPNWRFGERVPAAQMDALLHAGDVHVVSLDESVTGTCVPSKTYTALMRGKPVLYLGSDAGQAAQDVLAAGAGFVVPSDDPQAVREALLALSDPETRARKGAAGAAWARQHCERKNVIRAWIDLVGECLPARGRQAVATAL